MKLTRRRLSGLWVPVLLGAGGCTNRERDAAEGWSAPTTNGGVDGSTDSATATTETVADTADPTGVPPSSESPSGGDNPALSSTLVGLLAAEDRPAYARERGLAVDGSAVLVVVELVSADAELPSDHVRSVERRRGALVRAYVPFKALGPLAREEVVRFVRPPISGSAANATGGSS